jgi:hypothetical protein
MIHLAALPPDAFAGQMQREIVSSPLYPLFLSFTPGG